MSAVRLTKISCRSLQALPAAFSGRCRSVQTTSVTLNDSPTHTGQAFDPDDSRNVRFISTPRQTNERWAINLIKEVPPKGVDARVVACDGGPGALGHPRVYINLDQPGNHSCIYCGLRFYKKDSH
ncbi:NADH dehydrogenase [ubiquinone] iron-sulfur protein 6, mitochondrial-like [Macrobrachium nipponense]|uniref:NADH dehydrogenase [ubiquinone] iron-sulfur protein 6, mitochondrial-like n=1 Tax=Macrobrachium nipponense TaxID=159736 RepID=UPI0030C8BB7F